MTPSLETTYTAMWNTEVSPELTITVMPSVTLRMHAGAVFTSQVAGAHSFAGRLLRLQRDEHGTWRTIAAPRLSRASDADFHANLPRGRCRLRADFTAWQAGVGYLAGLSAEHVFRVS